MSCFLACEFLSVIRTHTHTLYLLPLLHLLLLFAFKNTFLDRNQDWAVQLPGMLSGLISGEGTLEVNLGF